MKSSRLGILLLLLLLPFVNGFAQRESLLIGPGDEVHVKVFDTPELDETARVSDAGDLQLILGGTIKVAGLSPEQAARSVENALVQAKVMYTPRVLVTVSLYATQNVSVFGSVVKPGVYPIGTARSVVDVLSLASGFAEFADRRVTIVRAGTGEQVTVLVPNDPKDSSATQVLVNPGDKVIVPRAHFVYVLGDVQKPGGYAMANNQNSLTTLQAVALAGGPLNTASIKHARLVHRTPDGGAQGTEFSLSDMMKGKRPDAPVQANDIIYVPFSIWRNTINNTIGGLVTVAASAFLYYPLR